MFSNILVNEVHIWFCRPEAIQEKEKLSAYLSVLSRQEIEQYNRFNYETDRHSYLVSHALLRHVLSKYAEVSPSEWQFSCNSHGKPGLLQSGSELQVGLPSIDFNLTHTKGLCACVATLGRSCGIDAEHIYRKNRLNAVAHRMFAEEELRVLAEGSQYQFYDFWTLREAYVKALGTGLAGSSKDYYFTVGMPDQAASINFRNKPSTGSDSWQFKLFQPTPEHRLAVAIESSEPMSVQISEFIP